MKSKLIIVVLLVFIFSCSEKKSEYFPVNGLTEIDSLETVDQIRDFLKNSDLQLNGFKYIQPQFYDPGFNDDYKIQIELDSIFHDFVSTKEDFDNNGYTDIILTGEHYRHKFGVIAIMNDGNKSYRKMPLSYLDRNEIPIFPKLFYKENKPAVELKSKASSWQKEKNGIFIKKLAYKWGEFLEPQITNEKYDIVQIEYSSKACHGTCPVFDLILNPDAKSTFIAKYFNFSRGKNINRNEEGYFEADLKTEDYSELCEIINFLQVKNLEEYYYSSGLHNPESILKVHFKDGSIKTIEDYGKMGTNGLVYLYNKLSALRFNQDWKKK